VSGPETERADVQPLHSVGRDRPLEVWRLRTFAEATGDQQEDRPIVQPPQRESECARRGRIEPLDVVDREDNRPLGGENLQRAPDRDTERAQIEAVRVFLNEECHLERVAPGRRHRRQYALEHVLEQVAEAGVGQPPFRFSRPIPATIKAPVTAPAPEQLSNSAKVCVPPRNILRRQSRGPGIAFDAMAAFSQNHCFRLADADQLGVDHRHF